MTSIPALDISLPRRGSRAIRRELYVQLEAAIADGRLKAGVQLPASRALAKSLAVSRNSVVDAYEKLLSEGRVICRQGAGTFVAAHPARRAVSAPPRFHRSVARGRVSPRARADKGMARQEFEFDLRPGVPDTSSFPFEIWGRLAGRALRLFARASARYREPAGHPALRQAIARHLSFARAMACDAEDVIVTVGAQQAFQLLARILAIEGRTTVAVEDPGYPATRLAFAAAGARVRPVPVDDNGLVVERLPRDTAIVCVTPSHQFPLGVPLSAARRRELLSFAAERNAVIVEDDYGGEFRFGGAAVAALHTKDREGRTFYVGTFSQSLLPALRIGFIVSPAWARERLIAQRELSDWHGPAIDHGALASFIAEGHLARHIRRMRKIYLERRTELLSRLNEVCNDKLQPMRSASGLHIAALFRGAFEERKVVEHAAARGLGLETLAPYAFKRTRTPGLALGFGLISRSRIPEAVHRLAESLQRSRL